MLRTVFGSALYIAAALSANADEIPADLLVGDMRGLVVHSEPVAASTLPYLITEDAEGHLADYEGQYVVLNFWATWCAPCREEMPSLQNLQREYGGEDFQVVTLATGRNPPQAIRRFFDEIGVTELTQHRDINQQIAREMAIFGLPITVILNRQGEEIARLRGDAHWDSDEAYAVIERLLSPGS